MAVSYYLIWRNSSLSVRRVTAAQKQKNKKYLLYTTEVLSVVYSWGFVCLINLSFWLLYSVDVLFVVYRVCCLTYTSEVLFDVYSLSIICPKELSCLFVVYSLGVVCCLQLRFVYFLLSPFLHVVLYFSKKKLGEIWLNKNRGDNRRV